MLERGSTALAERGPISGVHTAVGAAQPAARPLLASELLRQEIAPIEPGAIACRLWLLGVSAALVLLGVAFRLGIGVPVSRVESATVSFTAAGAIVAVAFLPFPYALRATIAMLAGASLMALGLGGDGPVAGAAVDAGLTRHAARMLTLTVLPAALLLRARYSAYGGARVALAVALVVALPFVVLEGLLMGDPAVSLVPRAGAAVSVLAVLASLFGFMGRESTGGGSVWAVLLLGVLPAEIALRQLTPLADADTGVLTYPATAVGLLCAAVLASTGLFQLAASFLGPNARREASAGEPLNEPVA